MSPPGFPAGPNTDEAAQRSRVLTGQELPDMPPKSTVGQWEGPVVPLHVATSPPSFFLCCWRTPSGWIKLHAARAELRQPRGPGLLFSMETPSHTRPLIGSYRHWTDALSYSIDNNGSPVGLEQKIPVRRRIFFFPQTVVPFKKLHPAISDNIFNSKFSPTHISTQMNVFNISASL